MDTIESYAGGASDPTLTFGATGITATTDVGFVDTDVTFATSGTKTLLDRIGDDRFTISSVVSGLCCNRQ